MEPQHGQGSGPSRPGDLQPPTGAGGMGWHGGPAAPHGRGPMNQDLGGIPIQGGPMATPGQPSAPWQQLPNSQMPSYSFNAPGQGLQMPPQGQAGFGYGGQGQAQGQHQLSPPVGLTTGYDNTHPAMGNMSGPGMPQYAMMQQPNSGTMGPGLGFAPQPGLNQPSFPMAHPMPPSAQGGMQFGNYGPGVHPSFGVVSVDQSRGPWAGAPSGIAPPPPAPQSMQQPEDSYEEDADPESPVENKAAQDATQRLYAYIEELGGKLEPGWRAVIKKRATGTTAGQTDIFFYAPTGRRYRSRSEIAKFLGLVTGAPTGRPDGKPGSDAANKAAGGRAGKGGGSKGPVVLPWSGDLPARLNADVTLHSLGSIQPGVPGIATPNALYPLNLTTSREMALVRPLPPSVWQAATGGTPLPADASDQAAGLPGDDSSVTLVSQIQPGSDAPRCCVIAVMKGPQGHQQLKVAEASTPDAVWQAVWDAQRKAIQQVTCAAASAAAVTVSAAVAAGTLDLKPDPNTLDTTLDGLPVAVDPTAPPSLEMMVQAAVEAAEQQQDAQVVAAASQAVQELPPVEALLACTAALPEPLWGKAEFAMSEVPLLLALEELPGVDQCTAYVPINDRPGGAQGDIKLLAKDAARHAREAAKAATKARTDLSKAAAKVAGTALRPKKRPAAGGVGGSGKRARADAPVHDPESAGGEGGDGLGSGGAGEAVAWLSDPAQHPDGFLAGVIAGGRGYTEASRSREAVARVLDRMITKLEDKDRKDKERDELKAARAAGKRRTPGLHGTDPHHDTYAPDTPLGAGGHDADVYMGEGDVAGWEGATHKSGRGAGKPVSPPAAPQQLGHVLVQALMAGLELKYIPDLDTSRPAADPSLSSLSPAAQVQTYLQACVQEMNTEDWGRLLQVWDFSSRFHRLLGLLQPPSLVDTLIMLLPHPPAHLGPQLQQQLLQAELVRRLSAAACAHINHMLTCLTRWVVDDLYFAIVAHVGDTPSIKKKELTVGLPVVEPSTCQDVVRRLMLGLAAAQVMADRQQISGMPSSTFPASKPETGSSKGSSDPSKQQPIHLPFPIASLDPMHWLALLLGGLPPDTYDPRDARDTRVVSSGSVGVKAEVQGQGREPAAGVSSEQQVAVETHPALRGLLLPPYMTKYAGDALVIDQEASALAAVERMMQQLRRQSKASDQAAAGKKATEGAAAAGDVAMVDASGGGAGGGVHSDVQRHSGDGASTPAGGEPGGGAGEHGGSKGAAGGAPSKGMFKIKIKSGAPGSGGALGVKSGGLDQPPTPSTASKRTPVSSVPPPDEECYEELDEQALALHEEHIELCGRKLIMDLCGVTSKKGGTGLHMGFCVAELTSLLKLPRGVDLRAVTARLRARAYQATGYPASALASDLRSMCVLWRGGADKVSHWGSDKAAQVLPAGFDLGGTHLAQLIEHKVAETMPHFTKLAPAPVNLQTSQPPNKAPLSRLAHAAEPAAAGAVAAHEGVHVNKEETTGPGGAQQQQQSGSNGAAAGVAAAVAVVKSEGAVKVEPGHVHARDDPRALSDVSRLFNPSGSGCRVCWRAMPTTSADVPVAHTGGVGRSRHAAQEAHLNRMVAVKVEEQDEEVVRCLLDCACCGDQYHTACLTPPLLKPPEPGTSWLCPTCASSQQLVKHEHKQQLAQQQQQQQQDSSMSALSPASLSKVQQYLTLAHLLGSCELLHPPAGDDVSNGNSVDVQGVQGSGWDVRSRLALLHVLVEAAVDVELVRKEVERMVEARDRTRKTHATLRAKMRKGGHEGGALGADGGMDMSGPGAGGGLVGLTGEEVELLSQLSDLDACVAARGGEDAITRRVCLGLDRHGNRYWLVAPPPPPELTTVPETPSASQPPGCVLVELAAPTPLRPPAFDPYALLDDQPPAEPQDDTPLPVGGWPGWSTALQGDGAVTAVAAVPPCPPAAWDGIAGDDSSWSPDVGEPAAWGLYTRADELGSLISNLSSSHAAEGPLRSALNRLKHALHAAAAHSARADPSFHPASSDHLPSVLQCVCLTDNVLPVPEGAWCTAATLDALDKETAAAGQLLGAFAQLTSSQHAEKLKEQLLDLYGKMSVTGVRQDGFWGSAFRQAQWQQYVHRCPATPAHLSVAITGLECMLADAAHKPHARHVVRPSHHPAAANTWASVHYRLAALQAAVTPPTVSTLEGTHLAYPPLDGPGQSAALLPRTAGKGQASPAASLYGGDSYLQAPGGALAPQNTGSGLRTSGRMRLPSNKLSDRGSEGPPELPAAPPSRASRASRGSRGSTAPLPPPAAGGAARSSARAGSRRGGTATPSHSYADMSGMGDLGHGVQLPGSCPSSVPSSPRDTLPPVPAAHGGYSMYQSSFPPAPPASTSYLNPVPALDIDDFDVRDLEAHFPAVDDMPDLPSDWVPGDEDSEGSGAHVARQHLAGWTPPPIQNTMAPCPPPRAFPPAPLPCT